MRIPWLVLLATVLSLPDSTAAAQRRGPPVPASRKEWNERYGRFADAVQKSDFKTFREMAAPDAAWLITSGKTLNTTQMQAEYARKLNAVKPNTQFTVNITKLNLNGNEAIVERTQVLAGFYTDSNGKRHRAFDGSGWEDRWIRSAAGWQLKAARQFNETLTVDGAPGNPYTQVTKKPLSRRSDNDRRRSKGV